MTEDFTQADLDALAFCVAILEQEPDVTYKEARREARLTKGLSVRRQVWTSAKRKLGIGQQDEVVDAAMADPSNCAGTAAPGADEESKSRTEDEKRSPSEPAQPVPEERWPQGRRPAWATPRGEQTPSADAPPPKSTPVSQHPIEFMVQYLQTKNSDATFDEVRLAAENAGYTVYPATFGRAQALAGILDSVEDGQPVPASASQPQPQPAKAAPQPAREHGEIDPVEGLRTFSKALSQRTKQRDHIKATAERMLEVVKQALAK